MRTDVSVWLERWFAKRSPHIALQNSDNIFEREAINSFGVIELIEDAEQQFNVQFTERDFQDRRFSTIDGLSEIIASKKTDAR